MTAASTPASGSRLRGTARRRRNEGAIRAILFAAAAVSVLISVGIVLSLVFEAISFLSKIQLSQLFADGWFPRRGQFSVPTVVAELAGSVEHVMGGLVQRVGAADQMAQRVVGLAAGVA